jgi:hypothetical protein
MSRRCPSGAGPNRPSPDRLQQVDPDQTGSTSLTEMLDACDGVLMPPIVGDQEINKRPPDTGEMREIKPRDLPGQQPNPALK